MADQQQRANVAAGADRGRVQACEDGGGLVELS
jgi:hypothetical protein